MLPIDFLIRAPFWVLCNKCVLAADYLSLEIGSEAWVVLCQSFDAQVATQERLPHIHMFDLHFDFVLLVVGCLVALKSTSRAKEG